MNIEESYPDAYRLARMFHELYEEVAPKFGYKTRGDTKEFDPNSPNGRTMAYVCKTIVDEEKEKAHQQGYNEAKEKAIDIFNKGYIKIDGLVACGNQLHIVVENPKSSQIILVDGEVLSNLNNI